MGPRRRLLVVHAAETPLGDGVAALAGRLAVAGCSVTVLTDFREARRYIADAAPDAVLTDLRLGAHNGLHLVVAAAARRPSVAAVVIGDAADEPLRRDAERLGAMFLTHPLIPGILEETVAAMLGAQGRRAKG